MVLTSFVGSIKDRESIGMLLKLSATEMTSSITREAFFLFLGADS